MKMLITGDLVINRPYSNDNIDLEIKDLFKNSDYNIVNLEAPVSKSTHKIIKTGPHLKSHRESTMNVLNELNVNLVTLANNHILDFGEEGVSDTIKFCKENNISTVGAGKNSTDASTIFYLETIEGKIAIINIAENEWASAGVNSAGSNGMDLINNSLQIKAAKENSDFVFVIVHGGHEYYNLPSPRMQKQYRYYIELGADLVVGHHPHCISGKEHFKNKEIYYSLGNFLFQKESVYNDWYYGSILEIEILNRKISTDIKFVSMEKESFALKMHNDNLIHERFDNYSKIIQDEDLLLSNWNEYVNAKKRVFMNYWSPFTSIGNRFLKKLFLKMGRDGISRKSAILYSNLVRCEAHLDLTKEFFKNKLN